MLAAARAEYTVALFWTDVLMKKYQLTMLLEYLRAALTAFLLLRDKKAEIIHFTQSMPKGGNI